MTSLERLVVNSTSIFRHRHHWELEEWARKAHAEIRAMAVARRRGIASLVNHLLRKVPSK